MEQFKSKSKAPKYLLKNSFFPIIFQKDSFTIEKIKKQSKGKKGKTNKSIKQKKEKKKRGKGIFYKLSLGNTMKALHKSKGGNGFLLVSGNINTKHSGKKIDEIEIVPNHHGRWFDIRYKYKVIDKVKIEPINKTTQISNNIPNDISLENFAAIDLGVVNLATIYSPNKNIRPFIINGREITHVNYTTKRALASLSRKYRKYRKYTDKHYTVLEKRQHRIHNCMHTASSAVIKYCQLNNIKQLVVGYNKNWKYKVNMGTKQNDKFYKIPFRSFVNMIFYKGQDNGINVVETNESYTSKCDALTDEHIGYNDNYSGNRSMRGLFVSGRLDSKGKPAIINADVNGAINILRKYINHYYSDLNDSLRESINDSIQLIKSPLKTNIISRLTYAKTMENIIVQCRVIRVCDYTQVNTEGNENNTIHVI